MCAHIRCEAIRLTWCDFPVLPFDSSYLVRLGRRCPSQLGEKDEKKAPEKEAEREHEKKYCGIGKPFLFLSTRFVFFICF